MLLVLLLLSIMPVEAERGMMFPIAPEDFRVVSSPSGWRVSPMLHILAYHDGIDVLAVERAQVVAAEDGRVTEIWPPPDGWFRGHPTFGGMIVIDHGNGFSTMYAHLSAALVVGWQKVRRGQVIGRIGSSGKTVGEHLHFVVRWKGRAVNPLLYVDAPRGKDE